MTTSPVMSGVASEIHDDRDPFLLPTTSDSANNSSSNGNSTRVRFLLRRPLELVRRIPLMCALCSVSGGVTWLVKGLFVCMGMMLMGGVGSFTLHQMMSPQIESLIQQRSELQKELESLQIQMENMTHIAESRLETIHLLEQELDKQAVEAAAVFAAAQSGQDNGAGGLHNGLRSPGAGFRGGAFILPTIVYAGLLGSVILVTVVYRIYRIIQVETHKHKRATARNSDHHHHDGSSPAMGRSSTSPTSSSLSIGIVDDAVDTTGAGALGVAHIAVLSPRNGDRNESSPQQCYKRTQLPSPTSRLMQV